MNELSIDSRLTGCFQAVFPDLSGSQIANATTDTVESWDSVAMVTLVSVVEEEFSTVLSPEEYGNLLSFAAFRDRLTQPAQ